jgi:hypothetical protein
MSKKKKFKRAVKIKALFFWGDVGRLKAVHKVLLFLPPHLCKNKEVTCGTKKKKKKKI